MNTDGHQSLSVHDEFDTLVQSFPAKQDSVVIPKGFKIKAELKATARVAVAVAGSRMRYRRSFISAELRSIIGLMLTSPGLIGPKFPQILAAAAFGKAEILRFYRHVGQQSNVRRDCKKHYVAEEYASVGGDVALLLSQLAELSELLQRFHFIAQRYYAEFLRINDVTALQPLIAATADRVATLRPILNSLMADLSARELSAESSATEDNSRITISGSVSARGPIKLGAGPGQRFRSVGSIDASKPTPGLGSIFGSGDADNAAGNGIGHSKEERAPREDFGSFRAGWDRAVSILCSQGIVTQAKDPAVDALCVRMHAAVERTMFLDSLEELLREHCEPYTAWWFHEAYWRGYEEAISAATPTTASQAGHISGYFNILRTVQLNVHRDFPSEQARLGSMAVRTCAVMLERLQDRLLASLRQVWDHFHALDTQFHPLEAAKRIERLIVAKHKKTTPLPEPLPGCESEAWAKVSIARLTGLRDNITQIMGAAHALGVFRVYNKEFHPVVLLKQRVEAYLEERLHGLFFTGAAEETLVRSSLALKKLWAGCQAAQMALSCTTAHFSTGLRALFFRDFVDISIPPPGVPVPTE